MAFWFVIYPVFFAAVLALRRHLYLPWFLLAAVSAVRFNVGSDFVSYRQMYLALTENTANQTWANKEFGYRLLVQGVDALGGNDQFVFALLAGSTLLLLYKATAYVFRQRLDAFVFASLLIIPVFYFYTLNGIRQALTVAVFAYALRYIVEGRWKAYHLVILLSVGVHLSAVFMLPLYSVLRSRPPRWLVGLGLSAAIAAAIYGPSKLIGFVFGSFGLPYSYYFENSELTQATGVPALLFTAISGLLVMRLQAVFDRRDMLENVVLNSMIAYSVIRLLAVDVDVVNRVALYFKPHFCFFVVMVLMKFIDWRPVVRHLAVSMFLFGVMAYAIAGIYLRAIGDGTYNQYAVNVCVVGDPCPLQIYGESDNLYNSE